jgi:hypothetical protein
MIGLGALNLYCVVFLLWKNLNPEVHPLGISSDANVTHTYNCELVRIVDANTVDINIDLGFDMWLHNHRCELTGVDLRNLSRSHNKDLAAELERMTSGRKLTIQSIMNKKDSFGRWMGVLHADGVNLNNKLETLKTLDE